MFELIIKKADQSIYWKEQFSSLAKAQAWLAVEQTRPYWNVGYSTQIIDHTPIPPTPEEQAIIDAAKEAKRLQLLNLRTRLQALDEAADLTVAEVKEALRKLVKYLRVNGLLD